MALIVGDRLGHYDVTALIGEGGMGQVYRATDTQLGRDVALKILPDAFAADPDRLARFQREAQVLASLNYPNIAQIHGVEQSDETRALVLELVEGPTLADRIAQGPIPLDEALPIAKQIAEALEAAHEAGVIHRDLKPANIKVREDGTVKVLDFGLAKAVLGDASGSDLSQSPTMTAAATATGVILGTAAYMSPEQARGKPVDKRSDIWSFGCVLFEMLTGQTAFLGETLSDTVVKILDREPEWAALPAEMPAAVNTLLRRCLDKDPRDRLRDIGDARVELREVFGPSSDAPLSATPASRSAMVLVAVAALVVGVIAAIALTSWLRVSESVPVRRFTISVPNDRYAWDAGVDISPDGSRVVFRGRRAGAPLSELFVRAIDQLEAEPLLELGNLPRNPFLSPDGNWVGYWEAHRRLRKVSISGGPFSEILDVQPLGGGVAGASWGADGYVVFGLGDDDPANGLWRVSADGGDPEVLTVRDGSRGEGDHAWPDVLPDGRGVLFTVVADPIENSQIAVFSQATQEHKVIIPRGRRPRFSPTGHVVYVLGDALWAVRFDLGSLNTIGESVRMVDRIGVLGPGGTREGETLGLAREEGSLLYRVPAPPTHEDPRVGRSKRQGG